MMKNPSRKLVVSISLLLITLLQAPPLFSASFYGSSYVALSLQDASSTTKLSFRMKTHRSDAILFLAAGPIDYCLLTLDSGVLKLRINLGSGEAVLTSKSGLRLNDLIWHHVEIDRTEGELQMTIDGLHSTYLDVPGRFFELNINYGVYVGGLGDFNELFLGNLKNYRGCIDQLVFNGVDIFENASKVSKGIESVTFDCSSEFEAQSRDPISFVETGAFLTLPGFANSRTGASLSFQLKTSSDVAIVFYNSGSPTHLTDFIAIEIINGRISLSANDGNGVVVLQSDVVVSDGYWHEVDVQFSPSYLEVSVDGKSRNLRPSLGENKFFDLSGSLYVGGLELNKQSFAFQQGLQSILSEGTESSLKGCLREIKVNQEVIGIREAETSKGIKASDCYWEFPCLIDYPCIAGAECYQEALNDFRCLCAENVCVKPNYTTTYKIYNYKTNAHVPLDLELLYLKPLNVVEGGSEFLTNQHISVLIDYEKYGLKDSGVIFHIIKPPKHGHLEIEFWKRSKAGYQGVTSEADNTFSYLDLKTNKIRYSHDGTENYNDTIKFTFEFYSRSFRLPPFLENQNHQFTLFVNVVAVNDAPKMVNKPQVLKLARNTKKALSADMLTAQDDDNPADEIKYALVVILDCLPCYLESVDNPGIPLQSFTQADVNANKVFFVHRRGNEAEYDVIKVVLSITDGNTQELLETVLEVHAFDLKLSMVRNTGILTMYSGHALITPYNFTFKTNADIDQSLDIKYDVIRGPKYGVIQKLRGNGHWFNVSSFNQRQINGNKIRYLHINEKPSTDIVSVQASCLDTKTTQPVEIRITFITFVLKVVTNEVLRFWTGNNGEELVKSLKYETQPFKVPTNQIIYTILSLPSLGSLYSISEVDSKRRDTLSMGSIVSQEMIDEGLLVYKSKEKVHPPAEDSFDFEVTTQGGLSDVQVSSFNILFTNSKAVPSTSTSSSSSSSSSSWSTAKESGASVGLTTQASLLDGQVSLFNHTPPSTSVIVKALIPSSSSSAPSTKLSVVKPFELTTRKVQPGGQEPFNRSSTSPAPRGGGGLIPSSTRRPLAKTIGRRTSTSTTSGPPTTDIIRPNINYMSIIITREHLIIVTIIFFIIIATVVLIACVIKTSSRTRYQSSKSGEKQENAKDQDHFTGESIIGSEYDGEVMLMNNHRHMSLQVTPSVSEMETCIPAPPTSPSVSTYCGSVTDQGSRSATPMKNYQLPLMHNHRLRGAEDDLEDSHELRGENVFPLPPPSLYFGTETAVDSSMPSSQWCTFHPNTLPSSKLTPCSTSLVPEHNFCSHTSGVHVSTVDSTSIRMMGDGNSNVGTPLPSLRKLPWSTEDLHHSCSSSASFTDHRPGPHCVNCQSPSKCRGTNAKGYFGNGVDTTRLHSMTSPTTPMLRRRQQYWV